MENKQDTVLLRDSFTSSSNYLKNIQESKGIISLNDEENAVKIVASTINTLSSNLYGINSFHELFRQQLDIKKRCHAVALVNLFRSQNIVCPEANNFYACVLYDINILNWSYYLRLNFLCQWSEYFIECACQLQPDILAIVLEKILEVQCTGELKFYACHLTLQAYIRKIFELSSPSVEKLKSEVNFAFNFCVPKSLEKDTKVIKSSTENLLTIFDFILTNLINESNQKSDINFIKVVLHGFKTIFRFGNTTHLERNISSCIEKLNLMVPLLEKCLTQETLVSAILENMKKPFNCLIDFGYQLMSWEINEIYLVFLIQQLWKDFETKPLTNLDSETSLNLVSNHCSDLISCLEQKNVSHVTLLDLNEKYLDSCSKSRDNYFILMSVIVKHHYPYASRAAECLLSNPQLWEQYNVIKLLEENIVVLQPLELHVALADAIVNASTTEMRDRLLDIFFKVLSRSTPEIYNTALVYILKKWGFCKSFMAANLEDQLNLLSRKTMSLKEAQESLLPLFVQSPKVVLQFLTDQAMMQGIDGMDALKILKTIPVACTYQCPEEPVSPLIAILSPYFEHSLRPNEAKHFLILLKTVMEIQVTKDILSFDSFLDKCIIPNSNTNNLDQLAFTLECLFISLDVVVSNHSMKISDEKYIYLLKHLLSILNFCIENGFGKLKETVVNIMELLSNYEKRSLILVLLKKEEDNPNEILCVSDVAKLYLIGIFCKERIPEQKEYVLLEWKNKVIKENFQYLLIWCCITGNIEDFKENVPVYKLSYVNLLTYLPTVLWHLSKNEWLQVAKLIKYYQQLLKLEVSDYKWLLPDNDPELYRVIRCLMDCFTLMMKEKSSRDILYCSSCLTNTIVELLNETTIPSSLLLNVFLDICCISSFINSEAFFMFSSVLMSLQKQYSSCEKAKKKNGIALMKSALNNIQNDSVDIASLIEKFCGL